jgi:signal transduction histidine kinase/ActR/RegA family two-component response regulator
VLAPNPQAELERRNAFLQLLQRVSIAANGAPTALDPALQSTLDEVCAHTQWTIGHVLMPSTDGSGDLASTGIWHIDDAAQLSALLGRHDNCRFGPGVGIPGRVFATGLPEHIADVRALADDHGDRVRCSLIDPENVRAVAGFPIILHEETVGVLEFFSEAPFEADGLLLDVLVQVGTLLGRVVERARYESALRAARETAEAASAAKTRFMSRMNHELRTPLNAVLGFAELLQLGQLAGDGERESVAAIEKAGDHLLALINDILDMSRTEEGALALTMEPVDIAEVVADVVGLLTPLAESRGVSLRAGALADDARTFVLADNRALKQILVNLVGNGIKYNSEGGSVVVTVAKSGEDRVRVAVSDSGWGIDPAHLSDLFVPFERLGSENAIEGTGLGLSIAKQLTEAMGSVLEVHSLPDSGSTFEIVLVETPAPAPTNDVDASSAHDVVSGSFPPITVLYVEDNLANIELVESIFKRQRPHFKLISTRLGEPAVGLALEHAPRIVLLDLDMPDINGAEVLKRLKLDSATRHIPVLIVSADAVPAQIESMLDAGAYDYIIKPINVGRLLELVDRALKGPIPAASMKLEGRPPITMVPS